MEKIKLYKYIGKNGSVITPVVLEHPIKYICYDLIASNGHFVTNGEKFLNHIIVFEDEINDWYEIKIDDKGQN